VLLSASGLLTAALRNLENQDFGFEQDRRMIVNFEASLAGYRAEQLTPLFRRIHDSIASIPGVASAALCSYSPLGGDSWNDAVFVDGHPAPGPNEDNMSGFERVTGGYFDAIGTPLLKGRGILDQDTDTSRRVAVVNQAFVRKFFPNEDPIGKHFGRSEFGARRLYEIVGVAKDARYMPYDLDRPIGPFFFLASDQHDVFPKAEFTASDVRSHFLHDLVVVVKPGSTVSSTELRGAIASVDPNIPVSLVQSLRDQVAGEFRQQRLIARITSLFGLLSLVLASIGLYGVTAFNAGRRVNEIGVRMALGAERGDVVALVLRSAFALIGVGLTVGVPLALAAGRFLGNQLYGMSPYNAVVISVAVAALGISALVASLIPALRASGISPLDALRAE
jgi:predicted permease